MIRRFVTPSDALAELGQRARALRLARNFGQAELAMRAGVSVPTIKRFEKSGHTSLENAYRIAAALHSEQSFEHLFEPPSYTSIDEALERPSRTQRQRVRKARR
jgi:transcriptional regulator with XRE-family HTH domain